MIHRILACIVLVLGFASVAMAQERFTVGINYGQPTWIQTEDYVGAQGKSGTEFDTKTFDIMAEARGNGKFSVEALISRSSLDNATSYYRSSSTDSNNPAGDWAGNFTQYQIGVSYHFMPRVSLLGGIQSTNLKLVYHGTWCCIELKFTQTETQKTLGTYIGTEFRQPLGQIVTLVGRVQTAIWSRRNDTMKLTNYPDTTYKNQSVVVDDVLAQAMVRFQVNEHLDLHTGYKYRQFTAPTGGGISIDPDYSVSRWSETTRLRGLVIGASYKF